MAENGMNSYVYFVLCPGNKHVWFWCFRFSFFNYHARWLAGKNVCFHAECYVRPELSRSANTAVSILPPKQMTMSLTF